MRISDWSSDVCSSDLVGVDQPDFLLLHLGIAFGDRAFAEAERLHLGAGERDAGFIFVLDGIIVARAPVLGDDLLLVETLGARTGHSDRSEEHTSELQSLMRISYAVFCLKKNTNNRKIK